jgi:hypothetical protein
MWLLFKAYSASWPGAEHALRLPDVRGVTQIDLSSANGGKIPHHDTDIIIALAS